MPPHSESALPNGKTALSRMERWVAALLLLAGLGLRCFYIVRYRYDSDEPQHLHTTWGWTQGLLQYRDFFDNHTPLFHLLFSPLVAVLGERTNILTFMRTAMVPLWFVSLWCVWRMGSHLYSRRAGIWSAVLVALLPWWFFCSIEYRTDNLWTPLWLGALTGFVTGRLSKLRAFGGGLLVGLCFCASMKTSALLVSAILAVLLALLLSRPHQAWGEIRSGAGVILAAIAGALVAPAALCAFFAAKGAWVPLIYGTIKHNILSGVDASNHPAYLRLALPMALPLLCLAAWQLGRMSPHASIAARRTFLFLTAGIYCATLYSVWTLLTRQDFLPFYPVVAVVAVPLFLHALEVAARRFGFAGNIERFQTCAFSGIAGAEIILILAGRPPGIDGTLREREILSEVLRLTRPGEYVMDFKGESIFRRRAFFYVLEPLTFVRLKRGLIADNIAQRLVDTRTCAVLNQDRWYPKDAVAFMTENYLPIGRLRVAGRMIARDAVTPAAAIGFEVVVPADYVIWADGQSVSGTLDGAPYQGATELRAGSHVFQPGEAHRRLAIFWARAVEAGFAPQFEGDGWQYYR